MTHSAEAQSPSRGVPRAGGTVRIKDPSPLNWLFITWNTVEEPVRTDADGRIVPAVLPTSGGRTAARRWRSTSGKASSSKTVNRSPLRT